MHAFQPVNRVDVLAWGIRYGESRCRLRKTTETVYELASESSYSLWLNWISFGLQSSNLWLLVATSVWNGILSFSLKLVRSALLSLRKQFVTSVGVGLMQFRLRGGAECLRSNWGIPSEREQKSIAHMQPHLVNSGQSRRYYAEAFDGWNALQEV